LGRRTAPLAARIKSAAYSPRWGSAIALALAAPCWANRPGIWRRSRPSPLAGEGGPRSGSDEGSRDVGDWRRAGSSAAPVNPSSVGFADTFSRGGRRGQATKCGGPARWGEREIGSRPRCAVVAALAFFAAGPCAAQTDNGLHGRLELQDAGQFTGPGTVEADLGDGAANDAVGNLRLTWAPTFGAWSFEVHDLVAAEDGPPVRLANLEQGLIAEPPSTWFDLTGVISRRGSLLATNTLDRLSVTYTAPQWVVRLGRQAITWGSGLVFRPMDLFDPFSPSAPDTEYKPGVDMLYVQRLFSDGSDLQLIAAPRPDHVGGPPTWEASSAALHYHFTLAGHSTTLLAAYDHGNWVTALGVNGDLAGATWNLELVPTVERSGAARISALANISEALTLAGRNATVFGEYFHNGFGVVTREPFDLTSLPADLLGELGRGQLFTLRQDYVAGGMSLEITPLITASPTLIVDADDSSVFLLAAATVSLSDNLVLIGGVQAPIGGPGTEYGGVRLSPANPARLAAPRQVYLQLRRYF
jgi:hypothetical protein